MPSGGKGKALYLQGFLNTSVGVALAAKATGDQGFRFTVRSVRQAQVLGPERHEDTDVNSTPPDDSKEKANRRRLILFGLALGAISLFMYVSFILKTAVRGP